MWNLKRLTRRQMLKVHPVLKVVKKKKKEKRKYMWNLNCLTRRQDVAGTWGDALRASQPERLLGARRGPIEKWRQCHGNPGSSAAGGSFSEPWGWCQWAPPEDPPSVHPAYLYGVRENRALFTIIPLTGLIQTNVIIHKITLIYDSIMMTDKELYIVSEWVSDTKTLSTGIWTALLFFIQDQDHFPS